MYCDYRQSDDLPSRLTNRTYFRSNNDHVITFMGRVITLRSHDYSIWSESRGHMPNRHYHWRSRVGWGWGGEQELSLYGGQVF